MVSKTRPGTYPLATARPERAAVVLPRRLALLHGADVEALCAAQTLPDALTMAVRFIAKTNACVVVEPAISGTDPVATRVYYRLGENADGLLGETHAFSAGPDNMVSITCYPDQEQQWHAYATAAPLTIRTRLRSALLQACFATATVDGATITKHVTRPYLTPVFSLVWSDRCAALTLWWRQHTTPSRTPPGHPAATPSGEAAAAARTMLTLLMHPTLAARVTFPENGNAPVLALDPQ